MVYWKNPKGVLKAVNSLVSAARGTCQYPLLRSRVVRYLALPSRSISSSTLGIGYGSKVDIEFNFLKSMQNLILPSFLGTSIIGHDHSLWEGSMMPISNMVSTSCLIFGRS